MLFRILCASKHALGGKGPSASITPTDGELKLVIRARYSPNIGLNTKVLLWSFNVLEFLGIPEPLGALFWIPTLVLVLYKNAWR